MRVHRILIRSLAVACLAATPAPAWEGPFNDMVVVRTVDAEAVTGRLERFSLDRGLAFGTRNGGGPLRIDAADVVSITTERTVETPSNGASVLNLLDGDRLIGVPVSMDEQGIRVESPTLGAVRVPLEQVVSWLTPDAWDAGWSDAVKAVEGNRPSASDIVLLRNGDTLGCTVLSAAGETVTVETPTGELNLPRSSVIAVWFLPLRPPAPTASRARIHLTDGARLTTREFAWNPPDAEIALLDGSKRSFPARRLAKVELLGERWEWLCDLDPISVEQTPMISVQWPHRLNRNVIGGPLKVAGESFDHGIGVHSRSVLIFDLKSEYGEFVTSYGLDDDSGPLADVDVLIRVDGQTRHRKTSVTPDVLHGPLRINVAGANRIELMVDFGRFSAVQDRFDWIEPALIRPPR